VTFDSSFMHAGGGSAGPNLDLEAIAHSQYLQAYTGDHPPEPELRPPRTAL
jgi:hypothetical protein